MLTWRMVWVVEEVGVRQHQQVREIERRGRVRTGDGGGEELHPRSGPVAWPGGEEIREE